MNIVHVKASFGGVNTHTNQYYMTLMWLGLLAEWYSKQLPSGTALAENLVSDTANILAFYPFSRRNTIHI